MPASKQPFEEPGEGLGFNKEAVIEKALCSPIALPFAMQIATLTPEQRREQRLPPNINVFSITIGMHIIPFFSSSTNIPKRLVMSDAHIGYEILNGTETFAEQKIRLFIAATEKRVVLEGEILLNDWEKLRSQCLTAMDVSKIESEMDVAYWQRRAEETKDGILRYGEEGKIQAGAAAELGYTPGGKTGMEDRAIIDHSARLFGVFDGVGGSGNGEIASTIAAETFHEIMSDSKIKYPTPAWRLRKAFAVTDERIRAYRDKAGISTPHTTAAVAHIEILPNDLRKAYIASMGDSRVFLCRKDGSIYPLTVDDAINRAFAMKGDLHRQRNKEENRYVTRSVGQTYRTKDFGESFEIREIVLQPEEFLVFTSDGIHDILATNQKERGRLSTHLYKKVEKLMRDIFATQKIEDIREYFTERHKPFNPLSKMMDPAFREMAFQFWNEEATLADAIWSALPDPTSEKPEPVDPQKVAGTIMELTKEINEIRSENSDLEHRSKTDNRAVVVAM